MTMMWFSSGRRNADFGPLPNLRQGDAALKLGIPLWRFFAQRMATPREVGAQSSRAAGCDRNDKHKPIDSLIRRSFPPKILAILL